MKGFLILDLRFAMEDRNDTKVRSLPLQDAF
jgi:hypothetical protein